MYVVMAKASLYGKCTAYESSSEKKDWPTGRHRRASYYYWMTVPAGFIDVEGHLFGGGAFYRGVTEDGVHLLVLDNGAAKVLS